MIAPTSSQHLSTQTIGSNSEQTTWSTRKVAIVAAAAFVCLAATLILVYYKSVTCTAWVVGGESVAIASLAFILSKFELKTPSSDTISAQSTDDEWGKLADGPIGDKAEHQTKLNRALRGKACPIRFHEKQEKGLCGRHAINNAFGEVVEDHNFKKRVAELMRQKDLPFDESMSDDDFGVDPEILRILLRNGKKAVETKISAISLMTGFEKSKSKAINDFLGKAEWFIGFNPKESHPIPAKTVVLYPLTPGHLFAARKEAGQWWIIDSRNPFVLDFPLTILRSDFVLIAPAL